MREDCDVLPPSGGPCVPGKRRAGDWAGAQQGEGAALRAEGLLSAQLALHPSQCPQPLAGTPSASGEAEDK